MMTSESDRLGRYRIAIDAPWDKTIQIGNFWHTGIVVADIDAAIADFHAHSGVRFVDPILVPLTVHDNIVGQPRQVTVRTAMSTGTPPYLELIEAIPNTVYAVGQVHLGFWCQSLSVTSKALSDSGYAQVMSDIGGKDGMPDMMCFHDSPGGYMVEVVGDHIKPRVEAHLAGGPPAVEQT